MIEIVFCTSPNKDFLLANLSLVFCFYNLLSVTSVVLCFSNEFVEKFKMLQQYLSDCEDYDQRSEHSETTYASEWVADRIAIYNSELINEAETSLNSERQVVNVRVDNVNIFGENQGDFFDLTRCNILKLLSLKAMKAVIQLR
jgi:hypothetical protein